MSEGRIRTRRFVFAVNPVSAARIKIGRYGPYYPKAYKRYKEKDFPPALAKALPKWWVPIPGAVTIRNILFEFKRPNKTTLAFPVPDIDNLQKALFDGCNGIIYEDDRQINVIRGSIEKKWAVAGKPGRTAMTVEWIEFG